MKAVKKGMQKSRKSTKATAKNRKGFTDEERIAMRERLEELKPDACRGWRLNNADGESAVLAKIAALPQPDRAMGERLHAIIKAKDRHAREESHELRTESPPDAASRMRLPIDPNPVVRRCCAVSNFETPLP